MKCNNRLTKAMALVAVVSLTASACGSDDDAAPSTDAATDTAVPDTAAPDTAAPDTEAPDSDDSVASTEPAGNLPGSGESFKVGVILPLTGPAASIGADFEAGLKVFGEIDPTAAQMDIEFVVCDDETTPDGASSCALRLSQQDNVDMIYGPVISGMHAGATPVLAGGPPSVTPSPYVSVEEGDPIFSAAGRASDLDRTTLEYAAERGFERVALLATTDTTGETAVQNIQAANEDLGLDIAIERMGPADVDVSSQINRLLETDPEYVYIGASGAAVGVALQGFSQAGSDLPTALIWSNTTKGFLDAAGPVMPTETLYGVAPSWLPENIDDPERAQLIRDFQEAFEAEAGVPPSFVVQGAYDAFQLIAAALLNTGGDSDAIVEYIEGLTDFQGLNWLLSYSETNRLGSESGNYVMMRYDPDSGSWSLAD